MIPRITLRKALADPKLLGGVIEGDSWRAWRTLLIATMGECLRDDERKLFTQLTGREREPLQPVEELIGVIGRRGGKSRAISVLASYIAGLCQHPALVAGERGVLLIIAPDQNQADICLNYTDAVFRGSPVLGQLIENRTARTLRLTNRIDIEVRASDFRRLRGPTYIAVIADESAFWLSSEYSANPDTEILNAVRPGLATTSGPLFVISSPYARRGELWRTFDKHFGAKGDPLILVAQGASRTFNPSLPQSVIDRAIERDAASAGAEYLAEFRRDIESFVSIEAVEACVSRGVFERAPIADVRYHAFVDPSGGSNDSMTMAIAHRENDVIILDCVRERFPPFSPDEVTKEFAAVIKSYHLSTVRGDRYAAEWPVERFDAHGVTYRVCDQVKSDLYQALLPILNSTRCSLLDNKRLVGQLVGLERRTGRGKDSIDHAPNQHDDLINSVAGATVAAAHRAPAQPPIVMPYIVGTPRNIPGGSVYAERRFGPWAGRL